MNILNQVILVGRLVKDPELKETEKNKKVSYITVAVPRSFKDANGEYQTDFFNVVLFDIVAKNTAEYCKKGSIIGVKGRLQMNVVEKENEEKKYYTDIIAEKITFLSSKSEDDLIEKEVEE
jgi:single-strand DNA-binding protein